MKNDDVKKEMELIIVTSNTEKVRELEAFLDCSLQIVNIDISEIQSVNIDDVIFHKTRSAFEVVGKPLLVEDSSLAIHAWNGLPGALIRWFMQTVGNEGICKMLREYNDRTATAEVIIGYCDGSNLRTFSGRVDGTIADEPRGTHGFGWDKIFQPHGTPRTFAEMSWNEKTTYSMRKIAASKLSEYLKNLSTSPSNLIG